MAGSRGSASGRPWDVVSHRQHALQHWGWEANACPNSSGTVPCGSRTVRPTGLPHICPKPALPLPHSTGAQFLHCSGLAVGVQGEPRPLRCGLSWVLGTGSPPLGGVPGRVFLSQCAWQGWAERVSCLFPPTM